MPPTEMKLADQHARRCDLMLVLGSSLIVNPAAALVGAAIRSGAHVVLINQGETPYDSMVALRLRDGIGDVLPPAVERARAILAA
jgi:NAD-dependent deacetylase